MATAFQVQERSVPPFEFSTDANRLQRDVIHGYLTASYWAAGIPREVVERKGLLVPVTELTPPRDGEQVQTRTVRFRTVGDITCTCPVDSPAATAAEIVLETLAADVSERGATRMDDKTSDASMEKRKKDGYF